VTLSDDIRKGLLLIFKEAVNNIAKHAEATYVKIVCELSGEDLLLTITDNGKGFKTETAERGHGLRNMTKRAEEIGAKLSIRSLPGGGTTIEICHKMT